MTSQETASRIRASVLGAALGDAIGAPFEFRTATAIPAATGEPWIDGLYPFQGATHPHGVWRDSPPAGTGTDDTRYNWLFLDLATRLGRVPSAEELAARFLEIYRSPEGVFPDYPDHARTQFEAWEGVCCGYLDRKSQLYPEVPPTVLRGRSIGLNYPTLIGLITLTSAGLMFAGRPEEAYAAAYQTDFVDVGYGRECVALLAAALSIAITGSAGPEDVFRQALSVDPFDLGGAFGGPLARERMPAFLSSVPSSSSDQELAEYLSRALASYHPFDPFKALAIALSAVLSHPTDPLRAILLSVNHRAIDGEGRLAGYLDTDCYGCVTGAVAGAIAAADAFPPDLLDRVAASNKETYGFDLEEAVDRFIEALR